MREKLEEIKRLVRDGDEELIFNVLFIDKGFEERLDIKDEALRIPHAWTIVCVSGAIELIIAGKSQRLEAGMLCVATPESLVKLVGATDDFTGFLAMSGSKFLEEMTRYNVDTLNFFEQNPCCKLEEDAYRSIHSLCRTSEEYNQRQGHKFYASFMRDLASLFLLELLAIYEYERVDMPNKISRKQQHYMDFIYLLKKHCDERWCVEDYAKAMNITSRYLTKICQSTANDNAVHCINRYTVDQICIRLLSSNASVLEISEMMNFQNMSYFIALFKRYKGCTPQQYRRNPSRHRI